MNYEKSESLSVNERRNNLLLSQVSEEERHVMIREVTARQTFSAFRLRVSFTLTLSGKSNEMK